jgi:hypothetical protein
LGLALVKAVAAQHHGRLVLGDNAPGLVVTFELPALLRERAPPAAAAPSAPSAPAADVTRAATAKP